MTEYNMLCPVCKSKIIKIGEGRLETLDEHVFNANGVHPVTDKLGCSNSNCPTFGIVFWDCEGGLYSGKNWREAREIKYIDDNDAPFGSYCRSSNVRFSHKFDKVIFKTRKFIYKIEYDIEADYNGNILKKRPILTIWKKDPENSGSTLKKRYPLTFYGWYRKIRSNIWYKNNKNMLGLEGKK